MKSFNIWKAFFIQGAYVLDPPAALRHRHHTRTHRHRGRNMGSLGVARHLGQASSIGTAVQRPASKLLLRDRDRGCPSPFRPSKLSSIPSLVQDNTEECIEAGEEEVEMGRSEEEAEEGGVEENEEEEVVGQEEAQQKEVEEEGGQEEEEEEVASGGRQEEGEGQEEEVQDLGRELDPAGPGTGVLRR